LEQIPSIASKNEDKIILYKVGDFVDISKGPMISNTSIIGRFEVTGIFDYGVDLKRIQGVSIPTQLNLHAWTFGQLAQRASKLNKYDEEMNRKREAKAASHFSKTSQEQDKMKQANA
jgi:large subunit ribosomal protein L39